MEAPQNATSAAPHAASLTGDQRYVVWTTTLATSLLSLMGSSFVVICYFLMFSNQSWVHIPKLKKFLFKLSAWTAMAQSLWFGYNIIDRVLVMTGIEGRQSRALCLLARVIFEFGSFSSLCWTVCTGVFVLFCAASVFTPESPPETKHYLLCHVLSWTIAAIVASLPIIFSSNASFGEFGNCLLKGELYIYSWLVPVGIVACLATIIWTLVFFKLRCSKPRKMQVSAKLQRKQRTFGNRVVLFSFTAVLWLPNIAMYVVLENKTDNAQTFALSVGYAILRNLMGVIQAIAFGSLAHAEISARYGLASRSKITQFLLILGFIILSPILLLPLYLRHLILVLRRLIRRCSSGEYYEDNSEDEYSRNGSDSLPSPLLSDMGSRYLAVQQYEQE